MTPLVTPSPLMNPTNYSNAAAQTGGAVAIITVGMIELAIGVLIVVAMWKVFAKAGRPGWASLIPFYNAWVMCEIAGRPGWWLFLLFVPFLNLVIAIIIMIELAKRFGKGGGFAVGLLLLGPIFFPILAFGDSTYQPSAV